eukprot:scaffold7210_cov32-Tisochrysis_lutea.AAC.7
MLEENLGSSCSGAPSSSSTTSEPSRPTTDTLATSSLAIGFASYSSALVAPSDSYHAGMLSAAVGALRGIAEPGRMGPREKEKAGARDGRARLGARGALGWGRGAEREEGSQRRRLPH